MLTVAIALIVWILFGVFGMKKKYVDKDKQPNKNRTNNKRSKNSMLKQHNNKQRLWMCPKFQGEPKWNGLLCQ